ncbi:beta-lactamase-like protein 2 homolog [Cylas formicarius]|uniref:beta-lactamase-like protein 2 homolog n=1 Tax=Cylas formicarius TaxID=197179 RepID=UPI0029585570|nr:beta-lactamase-like protein 2 homolog [Cylas formicarius]
MAAVIPTVTKVSPRITRILGCNPSSMTLQGTNTYVLGTGKRRILIDTGDEGISQYVSHLSNVLNEENIELAHIFLSHWHHDHVGGLTDIISKLGIRIKDCHVWKFPRLDAEDIVQKFELFEDGQEFVVEGATVKVFHTPGHSTDHAVFHLLEDNAVFSGDCILGEGTSIFENLYDYMKSLNLILKLQPCVIFPGHGNIIYDPAERLKYYLSHRQQREDQIIEVLKKNIGKGFTENALVLAIYTGLSEKLVKAAEYNVNHHLQKLLKEGKVLQIGELWQYNKL